MDDTSLQKFTVSAGVLEPDFDTSVYTYSLLLGAREEQVRFDWLTRDKGASCDLRGCPGNGKTLSLGKGGQKEVKLEVTSEDGCHTAVYKGKSS